MKLKKILSELEGIKARGNVEIEINGITINSKEVKQGYFFIAIEGFVTDGHKYIMSAIENGATAIMINTSRIQEFVNIIPQEVTIIAIENTRIAAAKCACNFYDKKNIG